MQSETLTTSSPILDETTRSFIKRAIIAGLVNIDQVKKVVESLMTDHSVFNSKLIASGLVGSGALTSWQANKLLAGKCKGFYLGSYRLLRPLGKGGMGVVYLGEHHVMKRLMALKILPVASSADPKRIERFKEEARASAQLDHANIVRANDFAESCGKLYIVMEFVDGIDLHYAVARDGVLTIPIAIDAVIQSANGLAHAHERGIVHRDIKPSNLLLRMDGVVKISDMGLARIGWPDASVTDGRRRLMGTADFVAPEQVIDSRTVDARADIYSLGCTLYYLLTGQPPYSGTSVAQRLAKHQTAPPPDLHKLRKDCPASLAELTMRMMAKRPEDRPTSALELIAQLKRLGGIPAGEATNPLTRIAPAGDTAVDDSVYQATIDDSSLSGDGEVSSVVVADDIDFGSLPPIEVAMPSQPPHLNLPASISPRRSAAAQLATPGRESAPAARGAEHQQLLLGIGLAVAVMALFLTVGVTAFSLASPQQPPPKIKSVEVGQGGNVIVIHRE